jgi:hypothetical protein
VTIFIGVLKLLIGNKAFTSFLAAPLLTEKVAISLIISQAGNLAASNPLNIWVFPSILAQVVRVGRIEALIPEHLSLGFTGFTKSHVILIT